MPFNNLAAVIAKLEAEGTFGKISQLKEINSEEELEAQQHEDDL